MRKFFACSVGEPGKGYDDENLQRIIELNAFVLHEDTVQKGVFGDIRAGDILLLKYKNLFIGYAEAKGVIITTEKGWNHTVPVHEWYFKDAANFSIGVSTYGIQSNTEAGAGQMGTVKRLDYSFALRKLEEIDRNTNLYKWLINEISIEREMVKMNRIIELLRHKGQVVLQGPPGTGKTRLAELLAVDLTREEQRQNISQVVELFFKNFQTSPEVQEDRIRLNNLLQDFYQKFPKASLQTLSLEDYAFGDGSNDSFCWWIEYGLYDLGAYTGQAGKFKIYWKSATQIYLKSGFFATILDDNEAMHSLAEQLSNVANEVNIEVALEKLSKGYVLKLLHTYNPEKYFPVNSEKCINNILKLLNINSVGLSLIQKNVAIQDYYLQKVNDLNADVTNIEFMRFLFNRFPGIKDNIEITQDEIVTKGEYKIVQFHPAYSYEDFVRGISANTNENGQIEYAVQNKTVVDFAEKAINNPNGSYVLIIDEINRANLPAVLGELIYALEYRGKKVDGLYEFKENRTILLPSNLLIIGTMNTADRSVGHIDYAIRRRFAFVDILPSKDPVADIALPYFKKVSELFIKNYDTLNWSLPKLEPAESLAPDFRPQDVWLGHSYFIIAEKNNDGAVLKPEEREAILTQKMRFEVLPLIEEYLKDGILLDTSAVKSVIDELSKIK